jgi:hypothetical protein
MAKNQPAPCKTIDEVKLSKKLVFITESILMLTWHEYK